MAPKRGIPPNSLSPQDSLNPNASSSTSLPRSTSPSSGFTQFLTRPSKWFSRSASTPKPSTPIAESRSSAGSGGRKHTISRPTDPRPILETYAGAGSRSVLDLSARPQGSADLPRFHTPSNPSSPTTTPHGGLGDLRNISRRPWSKSADDLSKVSVSHKDFTPVKASFQERIAEYRGRSDSNASVGSPISPSSPSLVNGRHPFPKISPSTSPPRSSTLPPVSISISTTSPDETPFPRSTSPTQIHTRSHSFTPKLPSKLSSPRYPPSPQRSNDREYDVRDLETPAPAHGTPTRAAFGFGFGGLNNPRPGYDLPSASSTPANNRVTTLLPPPTIVEPKPDRDEEVTSDSKRSSQIVFYSGFINRLADVPANFNHAASASLSKGWKPFKLELKGSKLYFYKPPGDRANAIKELFPFGLVPPTDEEVDDPASDVSANLVEDWDSSGRPRKAQGREDGNVPVAGRKKRAYWGRRTHPDLIRDDSGTIEKGTFEALTHQAVFATTFFGTPPTEDPTDISQDEQAGLETSQKARWYDFASSVIFCIPSIVGRQTFETEFLRCCSYLVSGADDDAREDAKTRVAWLANEYLRYHGQAADVPGWEEWKRDTIPDASLSAQDAGCSSLLTSTTSTQAMFQLSPALSSESPNVNTFSPRPDNAGKSISLMDALFLPKHQEKALEQPNSPRGGLAPPGGRSPWAALKEEGLTRDILLYFDPHLIARSLTFFHRSVMDQCPDNITAEYIISSDSSREDQDEPSSDPSSHLRHIFGSEEQPHWLTKLMLLQILGADTSSGQHYGNAPPNSPGRRSEDRGGQQTSRTHSRSELISVWARVGELCRAAGDECSWRAISAALCSRPVARLDKAWKRVNPQALAAIEAWSHFADNGPTTTVGHPQVTPWGGDTKVRATEELARARVDPTDPMLQMDSISRARSLFDEFRKTFLLCPRKNYVAENEISDDVRKLVAFWREMASEGGGMSGLAVKMQRVEQFMSLSLAAESRRRGLFEPHFWTRSNSTQAHSTSLLPLLFPDPLPTLTLMDRSRLVRARLDSDTADLQYLRSLDAQLRQEAGRQLQSLDSNQDFTKRLIMGSGGTLISVYNGDLLLIVQSGGFESAPNSRPSSSRAPSRPPSSAIEQGTEKSLSRNPSIRVKPSSSQGLDRKTSIARRSSLPSVSHLNRSNFVTVEHSSDPPLRVVVQAGTLNNLVNILVHGLENMSVSVADDNGEMSLREGMTRELVVDRAEFSRVWWNVFRSFVTPLVFFELLRKIYITSQPLGNSPSIADYLLVADKRTEVLDTIKEWLTIGGGAQDILDDAQLYNAVHAFMESRADHLVFKSAMLSNPAVQKAWESLTETLQSVKSTFISQTMRPTISRGLHNQRPHPARGTRARNISTRDPPDFDRMDPENFVENLDGMFSAAFSNVTEEDLYITADLLEVQSSDRTGWFSSRDAGSIEELVEIQTIYSHVQEVEPSSLISELTQDALYRLLPPGVRSCIRACAIIRKWLVAKLVAPRIGLRARQARMELLIQVIEVARLRNTETPSTPQLIDQPCVRSFVEAVATSALLSIESRMHHRAWQGIAIGRGASCESLAALLHRPYVQSTSSVDSLTVDMGWLLERMLEIIATPDMIEASSHEGHSLVNFDKRRHLCNLISKSSCLPSARKNATSEEANRRGFERLNNIEKEVINFQFDHRGIKEEAFREAATPSMSGSSTRKTVRPFNKVVAIQIEKNRRDKALRARLQREKLQEQSKNERRDDLLNKAMRPRKPLSNAQKQHRNKKSMSAFLSFMRPISSAFVSDTLQSSGLRRTPSKLDFSSTGKPALVLSIMDAQVAQFINNERSYTFQLDTEDGGHYLLQAINKREMTKWLETISRVTKMAAKRRLTYLGNSPQPKIADHIHHDPIIPSRDPKAVFAVELEFLLRRETGSEHIPTGTVPIIIEQCLSEIETRGLNEVGIYRIAGASTEINALKDAYNRGEYPIRQTTDIHALCDLVKSWFRVLPEPVFPPSSYHNVMEAMRQENLDDRLLSIRNVVQALPQANFDILRRVSEHLDKVTDYEEYNHMTAEALAIVFSPNLLRAPQNDFVMILNNMGLSHKLVKALITHFHLIFADADPEGEELHSEDDADSAILEEDEEEDEEATYEPMHDSHDDSPPPENGSQYTPN